MAELKLRVTVDAPLVVPEGIPGPSESVAPADGVLISQSLLLSEQLIYEFVVAIASGVAANVATEAVKTLIRRLREKNGAARFTLEQEEVTLDDEGHVREVVTTRLQQQDRQRRS